MTEKFGGKTVFNDRSLLFCRPKSPHAVEIIFGQIRQRFFVSVLQYILPYFYVRMFSSFSNSDKSGRYHSTLPDSSNV